MLKYYRIWLNLLLLLMQSLHKFVRVLCILHIISRSLCIGCSSSILVPCERWNENKNIVYIIIVYCLLLSAFVARAMFIIFKFNIASAIRHFHYDIPATRPLWCHNSKVAYPYGLRKCKRRTSDTYRYTELLKGYQIGKIPTYMEETHV